MIILRHPTSIWIAPWSTTRIVNKKTPNNKEEPVASEIDSDLQEDNTYEFQDKVLSCLFKLELSASTAKKSVEMMEEGIKSLRTYIHGENIDGWKTK